MFRDGSPDENNSFGALPRESIAVGATPLAARESAVRLQMTMREEDYTHIQSFRFHVLHTFICPTHSFKNICIIFHASSHVNY